MEWPLEAGNGFQQIASRTTGTLALQLQGTEIDQQPHRQEIVFARTSGKDHSLRTP